MAKGPYAVGLDIGGTFTDLVLLDSDGGTEAHKLLTTPDNPEQAALQGVSDLLRGSSVDIGDVDLLVHSTTLVTNALTQQRGATTGLIATRGFRDILEMRNEHRYDIYDLFLELARPARAARTTSHGATSGSPATARCSSTPEESESRGGLARLRRDDVEAIASAFLHSYRNPVNEQKVVPRWAQARAAHSGDTLIGGCAGHPRVRAHVDRRC